MPELPEVETMRRQLAKEAGGALIKDVRVLFSKRLNVSADEFRRLVKGTRVRSVGRRAKLLLLHLSNGWTMVVHLKMTGRFRLAGPRERPGKHTHLVFRLSGSKVLFFEDVRKFGFVRLFPTDRLKKEVFDKERYGPEPLQSNFNFDRFLGCLRAKGGKRIKPALMDQTCVAGVGNIYADESCWYGRVRPDRRVRSLSRKEAADLYRGMLGSLRRAISHRGTSADAYLDLYGREGAYVSRLKVYGRESGRCVRCGSAIVKTRLAGRGTHFCPKCQK